MIIILFTNSLVIILTKLNEKIELFKKGASISTIKINVKQNLTMFRNILCAERKKRGKQESASKWIMNLYTVSKIF